jgi:hypothetical protein
MINTLVEAIALIFCTRCRNEIEDGACSSCGNPFEHASRVYCNGDIEHYCRECYEELSSDED